MPATAVAGPAGSLVVGGGRRPSKDADDRFTVFTLDVATGAIHGCGDGTVDPGEACDDGNAAGDDCCAADCKTAAPDGTACSDGNPCTNDHCNGSGCQKECDSLHSRLPWDGG
jgi:cysteine-rich repeat protein